MSWTLVNSNYSTGSNTVQVTGVGANNLVVVGVMWATGIGAPGVMVEDGKSVFTPGTMCTIGGTSCYLQYFYLLSSVATGTVTYTCDIPADSYTATATYMFAFAFSNSQGYAAFDVQSTGTGSSTTLSSGTFSTTGTDELILGLGYVPSYGISAPLIAGAAATGTTSGGAGAWYKTFAQTESSITAAATASSAVAWGCAALSFYGTASAPATPAPAINLRYEASSSGSTTVQLTGVQSGDCIVVGCKYTGSSSGCTISDGTSSFTMDSSSLINGTLEFGYLLSSKATGTVTYTVTFPSGATNQIIWAWGFYGPASTTFALDTQATGAAAATGSFSTTAASEVACAIAYYPNNSVDGTGCFVGQYYNDGYDSNGSSTGWYKTLGCGAKSGLTAYDAGSSYISAIIMKATNVTNLSVGPISDSVSAIADVVSNILVKYGNLSIPTISDTFTSNEVLSQMGFGRLLIPTISDTFTSNEALAVALSWAINKSDTFTSNEAMSNMLLDLLVSGIVDTFTSNETFTPFWYWPYLYVTGIWERLTTSEASLIGLGAYLLSLSDTFITSDVGASTLDNFLVSSTDTFTVNDTNQLLLYYAFLLVTDNDTFTINETEQVLFGNLVLSAVENITANEALLYIFLSALAVQGVNETFTANDVPAFGLSPNIKVTDSLTANEVLTMALSWAISNQETFTANDTTQFLYNSFAAQMSDSLTVNENTLDVLTLLLISLEDNATTSDLPQIFFDAFFIMTNETLTFKDMQTVYGGNVLPLIVQDIMTANDIPWLLFDSYALMPQETMTLNEMQISVFDVLNTFGQETITHNETLISLLDRFVVRPVENISTSESGVSTFLYFCFLLTICSDTFTPSDLSTPLFGAWLVSETETFIGSDIAPLFHYSAWAVDASETLTLSDLVGRMLLNRSLYILTQSGIGIGDVERTLLDKFLVFGEESISTAEGWENTLLSLLAVRQQENVSTNETLRMLWIWPFLYLIFNERLGFFGADAQVGLNPMRLVQHDTMTGSEFIPNLNLGSLRIKVTETMISAIVYQSLLDSLVLHPKETFKMGAEQASALDLYLLSYQDVISMKDTQLSTLDLLLLSSIESFVMYHDFDRVLLGTYLVSRDENIGIDDLQRTLFKQLVLSQMENIGIDDSLEFLVYFARLYIAFGDSIIANELEDVLFKSLNVRAHDTITSNEFEAFFFESLAAQVTDKMIGSDAFAGVYFNLLAAQATDTVISSDISVMYLLLYLIRKYARKFIVDFHPEEELAISLYQGDSSDDLVVKYTDDNGFQVTFDDTWQSRMYIIDNLSNQHVFFLKYLNMWPDGSYFVGFINSGESSHLSPGEYILIVELLNPVQEFSETQYIDLTIKETI